MKDSLCASARVRPEPISDAEIADLKAGLHMFPGDWATAILSLLARLDKAETALRRLSTFEAFTTEGWGHAHPEQTARVEYAREALMVGISEDREPFQALEAAYIRGAKWSLEMGMRYKMPELRKAAYDYADKVTSPVGSGRTLADAANHNPHVP